MAMATDVAPAAQGGVSRLLVALFLLAAVLQFAVNAVWTHHPPDLAALYMAGHFYGTGEYGLIYAAPEGFFGRTAPEWASATRVLGMGDDLAMPYVYPPLWAALLSVPTGGLAPTAFFQSASILIAVLLGGSVFLAWRIARDFAVPLWIWVVISAPILASSAMVQMAMFQLQPHVLVVFLLLLAFERYSSEAFLAAGIALGFAVALKLSPAPLALIFLLDRNGRALAGFGGTVAACGVASLWVGGVALHQDFFASMAAAVAGTYITGVTFSAEIPLNGLAALFGLIEPIDTLGRNVRLAETPMIIGLVGKAILLGCLLWMLFVTARLDSARRLVARVFLISLIFALFGPLGWVFYFLPQMFLLPALIGLVPKRIGIAVLIGAVVLTSWPLHVAFGFVVEGDFYRASLGAMSLFALFLSVVLALQKAPGSKGASPAL